MQALRSLFPLVSTLRAQVAPETDGGRDPSGSAPRDVTGAEMAVLSYSCTTIVAMVVRKKRSISMPPDLDTNIEAAASAAGMTYSGWLAAMARKEFMLRAGLDAVAGFEKEHGSFTPDELAEAETWATETLVRSNRTGARRRQTA